MQLPERLLSFLIIYNRIIQNYGANKKDVLIKKKFGEKNRKVNKISRKGLNVTDYL